MSTAENIDQLKTLIAEARIKTFSSLLFEQYQFEILTAESELWKHYSHKLFALIPYDLYFSPEALYTEHEQQKLNILNANISFGIKDSFLLRDIKNNNQVVALYHGWQKDHDSYYMQTSFIHKDYRRKGIYSALIDRILEYTKLLGFNRILSCHSPCNNAVLIAKLKKGFNVMGMDVDPALGTNVWLCYFHNIDLKSAFEFRCGHISFNEKLYAASYGNAELLYNELSAAKSAAKKK